MKLPDIQSRQASAGVLAAVLLLSAQSGLRANGFYIPVQDPFAASRGNAFAATADRPSAVYYNPAGLTQLHSRTAHVGVYGVRLGIEADTAIDGGRHENDAEFIPVPQLYLAAPINDRLAAGVGLNSPFGLRTDWGSATPFGGVATETDLTYATAWGVLAYELSDSLSVGGGIGMTYADGTLKRLAAPQLAPGAEFEFEGDDVAANWIASLLWKPEEQHSFGITYRAKTDLDLEGSGGAPAVGLPNGRASLDLVTPDTLVVGYAYQPDDHWTLEANVEWVNWNRLGTSTLRQAFSADSPIPFNWESNFMYGIGVTYAPNETWAFNAGYIFIENSQPDLTFNPAVADADRHWLSAGVSYKAENWAIDLAYQYAFSDRTVEDRTAGFDAGDLVAGDYQSRFHGLMLSFNRSF
ncbi:MAG: outer membrane protein transport protein [Roseibacillus sp.]|nr:outer membrane protein transport protein [Roseibacillus sp.]